MNTPVYCLLVFSRCDKDHANLMEFPEAFCLIMFNLYLSNSFMKMIEEIGDHTTLHLGMKYLPGP